MFLPINSNHHQIFLSMKKKLPLLLCILMLVFIIISHQAVAQSMMNLAIAANPGTGSPAGPDATASITTVQKLVTGNVTDENRNPVSGASVSIKGTSIGTTTDANGRF